MDGYYNYLLTFIDKAVDDGFIKPSQRHIIVSAPNAKELVQKLEVGLYQNKKKHPVPFLPFFFFFIVSVGFRFLSGKDNLEIKRENLVRLPY